MALFYDQLDRVNQVLAHPTKEHDSRLAKIAAVAAIGGVAIATFLGFKYDTESAPTPAEAEVCVLTVDETNLAWDFASKLADEIGSRPDAVIANLQANNSNLPPQLFRGQQLIASEELC